MRKRLFSCSVARNASHAKGRFYLRAVGLYANRFGAALRPWGFWGDKENQKQFLTEIAKNLGVREVTSPTLGSKTLAHSNPLSLRDGMTYRGVISKD